ncbi:hypothetical protein D3C86_1725260 [compost metagenome]
MLDDGGQVHDAAEALEQRVLRPRVRLEQLPFDRGDGAHRLLPRSIIPFRLVPHQRDGMPWSIRSARQRFEQVAAQETGGARDQERPAHETVLSSPAGIIAAPWDSSSGQRQASAYAAIASACIPQR